MIFNNRQLAVISLILFLSANSIAFAAENMDEFITQTQKKQFIDDDLPSGYTSAKEAIKQIPKRADVKYTERLAPTIMSYSTDASTKMYWWVMEKGNEYYPSVVRRRVVVQSDGFVVKTSILCSASENLCQKLRAGLQAMDSSK